MSGMQSIRETFFEECEELLEALSEGLGLIEAEAHDSETVNAVFRAVHSIKGGGAAFGLDDLVSFAHRYETVLDALRSGRMELEPEVVRVLLRSADHLAGLVEAARNEDPVDPALTAGFLANLDLCLGDEADEFIDNGAPDFGFAAQPLALDFLAPDPAPPGFHVHFRPLAEFHANGHDPAGLFGALAELGPLGVEADLSDLPDWDGMDPDSAWLAWDLHLENVADEGAIRAVFEFAEGLCRLEITPLSETPAPASDPFAFLSPPEDPGAADPAFAPALAADEDAQPADRAAPSSPVPPRAARGQDADRSGPRPTLRVDLERVDRLIDTVGELIINQAMIEQRVFDLSLATDAEVITHVEDYRLLARDLQEAVMAIRAQPVKPLFQRMSRILREAGEATGKPARLVTTGESVEVDKTVIERLTDPLTHMIRNAVDHGLESREARIAAGKPAEGTVQLSAAHRSGAVQITLKDDGGGLNRARILERARARGLVAPGATPSDAEIDNLLFLPGFSTAEKVSALSGRGVGLDVVRNAVTALGGRITIASLPGLGTEFVISLPLTLAVMDGMVISVAGQTMVIPISSVVETIRPGPADLYPIGQDDRLLSVRGRLLPMVDVAECLGMSRPSGQSPPILLLVETEHQAQCALVVDAVLDQRQVVIKGLETNYGSIPGVSAATVLGDGRIALILDCEALTAGRPTNAAPALAGSTGELSHVAS